jgi:hypothetical protein
MFVGPFILLALEATDGFRVINRATLVRSEDFTAMTMKNVAFWDIKTQFVLHRRHILLRYRVQPVNAM